ncbi:hypothetical protein MMC28_008981 [Mycoblastus sanguinarius]|nr:hypothetical protein [Mycoblastus sanguinarius]
MSELLQVSPKWIPVKVEVIANAAGFKRQVSAMTELLRHPDARPFHIFFLNQRPTDCETTDLVKLSGLSEPQALSTKNAVLGRAQLNREQLKAFDCGRILHDCFAIIQGYPSTGKPQLITAIAAYLVSLGLHVACGAAATHDATDKVIEDMTEILVASKDAELKKIKPIRVYRSMREEKQEPRSKQVRR